MRHGSIALRARIRPHTQARIQARIRGHTTATVTSIKFVGI
jgi:hypothetical protein